MSIKNIYELRIERDLTTKDEFEEEMFNIMGLIGFDERKDLLSVDELKFRINFENLKVMEDSDKIEALETLLTYIDTGLIEKIQFLLKDYGLVERKAKG